MGIAAGVVLFAGLFAYVFWPEKNPFVQQAATRLDFLRERKDAVFINLRDLNFEYKAGKYPEEDYGTQRALLEDEAAEILTEMEALERR